MTVDMTDIKGYLGDSSVWSDDDIEKALNAETAAQAKNCNIPEAGSDDLDEALRRRVAHNLAVRNLPLGIQSSISDLGPTSVRVGGTDAEVARLESPYRKKVVG